MIKHPPKLPLDELIYNSTGRYLEEVIDYFYIAPEVVDYLLKKYVQLNPDTKPGILLTQISNKYVWLYVACQKLRQKIKLDKTY